ncbi:nucleotidyltransferase family protein [Ningiella sp. W23]|uniref:nucleotidyltransferase family protein n=1 Tax=Ningiella sp. W23 TaxID=3023715 RepID=UPI003757B1DC
MKSFNFVANSCLSRTFFLEHKAEYDLDLLFLNDEMRRLAGVFFANCRDLIESPKTLERLKHINAQLVAMHLKHKSFINTLVSDLEENQMTIILLKSSAFNGSLYHSSSPRGNSDIDILVLDKDFHKFGNIIAKYARPFAPKIARPLDNSYESTWISDNDASVIIDVHFALINPALFKIDHAGLFLQSAKHPAFHSDRIRILCSEHNMLHSALHIFSDGYIPHHSSLDAAMLVKNLQPNIEAARYNSMKWGCRTAFDFLLLELNSTFPQITLESASLVKNSKMLLLRKILKHRYRKHSLKRRIQQLLLQYFMSDSPLRALKLQLQYVKARVLN